VARRAHDRVRLRLPHRDGNANRNGTLHGGVLASLALIGGTLAAAGDDAGAGATVDLAVHYVAPATRSAVTVDAIVVRRGRRLAFVDVAISAGRTPVVRALVGYRLRAARSGETCPPPPVVDDARTRRSGSPFTRALGVRMADLGRGHAVALLPDQPAILAADGRVHEGAIATLVDCAGGASAWSVVGFDPSRRAATVGMHLVFDPAVAGEDLVAEARTPWRSGGILVNAVTVTGRTSGRPVATGSVTYRI